MLRSRKLRKAADDWWIHPDLKKKLVTAAWNEIGVMKHQLLSVHEPHQSVWNYRESIYLAETVLLTLGEKTDEEMEDV